MWKSYWSLLLSSWLLPHSDSSFTLHEPLMASCCLWEKFQTLTFKAFHIRASLSSYIPDTLLPLLNCNVCFPLSLPLKKKILAIDYAILSGSKNLLDISVYQNLTHYSRHHLDSISSMKTVLKIPCRNICFLI